MVPIMKFVVTEVHQELLLPPAKHGLPTPLGVLGGGLASYGVYPGAAECEAWDDGNPVAIAALTQIVDDEVHLELGVCRAKHW